MWQSTEEQVQNAGSNENQQSPFGGARTGLRAPSAGPGGPQTESIGPPPPAGVGGGPGAPQRWAGELGSRATGLGVQGGAMRAGLPWGPAMLGNGLHTDEKNGHGGGHRDGHRPGHHEGHREGTATERGGTLAAAGRRVLSGVAAHSPWGEAMRGDSKGPDGAAGAIGAGLRGAGQAAVQPLFGHWGDDVQAGVHSGLRGALGGDVKPAGAAHGHGGKPTGAEADHNAAAIGAGSAAGLAADDEQTAQVGAEVEGETEGAPSPGKARSRTARKGVVSARGALGNARPDGDPDEPGADGAHHAAGIAKAEGAIQHKPDGAEAHAELRHAGGVTAAGAPAQGTDAPVSAGATAHEAGAAAVLASHERQHAAPNALEHAEHGKQNDKEPAEPGKEHKGLGKEHKELGKQDAELGKEHKEPAEPGKEHKELGREHKELGKEPASEPGKQHGEHSKEHAEPGKGHGAHEQAGAEHAGAEHGARHAGHEAGGEHHMAELAREAAHGAGSEHVAEAAAHGGAAGAAAAMGTHPAQEAAGPGHGEDRGHGQAGAEHGAAAGGEHGAGEHGAVDKAGAAGGGDAKHAAEPGADAKGEGAPGKRTEEKLGEAAARSGEQAEQHGKQAHKEAPADLHMQLHKKGGADKDHGHGEHGDVKTQLNDNVGSPAAEKDMMSGNAAEHGVAPPAGGSEHAAHAEHATGAHAGESAAKPAPVLGEQIDAAPAPGSTTTE